MTTLARALVQTAPHESEFRDIPLPLLSDGAGLLRVEANGLCATDIDAVANTLGGAYTMPLPRINGHEIVGIIEELTPGALSRQGFQPGDRVALNPFLSCGQCSPCLSGNIVLCTGFPFLPHTYGYIPTAVEPQLWGGYSTHVYLHPRSILYKIPHEVSPLDATLWNPLAAGIQWSVLNTGSGIGSTVAVLGAGQRGLASIVANKLAGADLIIATGLSSDRHKLDLALELGADAVIDVEKEDTVSRVMELTGGRGVDIVIDTSSHAVQPVLDAVSIIKPGGIISLAGLKMRNMDGFPVDTIVTKGIRIAGSVGMSHQAYDLAARMVSEMRIPLNKMRTHVLGYDRFDEAIDLLANRVPGQHAINIVVTPTFESERASARNDPSTGSELAP